MQAPPTPPAETDPLATSIKAFLAGLAENPRAAILWTFAVLAGSDVVFKHGATLKKLWRVTVVVLLYLWDFVLGPAKVRRLEKRLAETSKKIEPVHAEGVIWFPSETEAGACEAYCEFCWSAGRRIALNSFLQDGGKAIRFYCDKSREHPSIGVDISPERLEYLRKHAFDLRNAQRL